MKLPKPYTTKQYAELAIFCNQNNCRIEDKGDYLESVPNPDPEITIADYDAAMENHIRQACIDRGYTTREPDVYLNSRNERWKQDAEDFILFRDAVMEYGLAVQNEYKETGIAPTLDDFKAGLPVITWTYE